MRDEWKHFLDLAVELNDVEAIERVKNGIHPFRCEHLHPNRGRRWKVVGRL